MPKIEFVEDEEEIEVNDQEHEFLVGDFVWGKIKSHPWWPGKIYDPSDASKNAVKYQRRDRHLVAYFGDGTFAWCYPSQLKPFQENFDEMVKQSSSKSFLKAVEEAVDEIGRCLELEMTCSCVAEEPRTRPLTVNAGIKEGVFVPDGGIGELSITQYEPMEFLSRLRHIAQVVSVTNLVELIVFKSRLSAFYRAKGYSQLPMYHEPIGITDPIKNAGNVIESNGGLEVQTMDLTVSPAEEDWISSPVGPWSGRTSLSFSRNFSGISEEKLYQRKKQRSMAELLAKDTDVKPEENGVSDVAEEETVSGKQKLESKKRKKNKGLKVGNDSEVVEEDSGGSKRANPKKLKKTKISENDGGVIEEGSKFGSLLRERKKSKYLSPPYTNPTRGNTSLISAKVSEMDSPNAPKVSRLGDCIGRAENQDTASPPIVKDTGKTFQKKVSKESNIERKTYGSLSPRTLTENRNKIALEEGNVKKVLEESRVERKTFGSLRPRTPKPNRNKIVLEEGNVSAHEMFMEFRSAAMDPLRLKEKQTLNAFKGFFIRLRSSLYHEGSDFVMYNKSVSGRGRRKKISIDVKPNSHEKDQTVSKGKLEQKKRKGKDEPTLQIPKKQRKSAIGTPDVKNRRRVTKGEASAAALLLTFSPGVSLPSKGDLITIFGKFGSLNESETEILKDSGCARVVYVRSSDAEEAYKCSDKISYFIPSVVSYRLRYLSAFAKASEHVENSLKKQSALPSLRSIRKNLKTAGSLLGKSWDKLSPEVKANLDDQVKGLLKQVSTMGESSSS